MTRRTAPDAPPTRAAGPVAGSVRPSSPRMVGLLAVAVGCGFALFRLGAGELQVPFSSGSAFADWLEGTPPPTMAIAVVRYAALATCAYFVVVLGAALALTAGGRVRAAHRSLRLTPVAIRRLVAGGVGIGLVTQTAFGPAAAGAEEAAPGGREEIAVMVQLGPADDLPEPGTSTGAHDPSEPARDPGGDAEAEVATMEVMDGSVPDDDRGPATTTVVPDTTTTSTADPASDITTTAPETPADALEGGGSGDGDRAGSRGETWVVEPGDSFWSIAERLAAEDGSRDVAGYWERLLDANLAHLADPANPDLLFPGQELTLPR